ncbi:MAG: chemotaxis protein CheW [Actinobacteria bacterium]|nr:chemotaxis protein CheW [Actinomycetota bacterium]MCG2802689.1 chemotaxis protein CheW [Cellulomonas sp.]
MSQYVTFTLDGTLYGVDVLRVQEALRSHTRTRVPLAPETVAGLVNLRGQVVLTVDLRTRLSLAAREVGVEPMMVVVRVDDEAISLLVDEIGDVVDADADTFAPPPDTLEAEMRSVVVGAHKLDDRLLLVLDVDRAVA